MASVLCCYSLLSNAQETTNNIITNNCSAWVGNKICTSGDGAWGGTSGGSIPNIGETGAIRFGYTNQMLAQIIGINQALAQTGLQVDGYNYSWAIKNYNVGGHQSFNAQDPLRITIEIKNSSGVTVESYTYDYSYWISNWTTFSGSETFNESYLTQDLSTLSLTVAGRDAGYWAGYYGPEVRDIDVRLRYSVAPPPPPQPVEPATTSTPTVVQEEREAPVAQAVETSPIVEQPIAIASAVEPVATQEITQTAEPQQSTTQESTQQSSQPQQTSSTGSMSADQQSTGQSERREERSRASEEAKQQAVADAISPVSPIAIVPSLSSQLEQSSIDSQTNISVSSGNSDNNGSNIETTEAKAEDQETKEQNETMSTLASNDRLDSYNKVIPDREFYAAVQVYKNLIVPENKRGLRMGLASELLWDKLVEQQYK